MSSFQTILLVCILISEILSWVYRGYLEWEQRSTSASPDISYDPTGPFGEDDDYPQPIEIIPLTPTLKDSLGQPRMVAEVDITDFFGPNGEPLPPHPSIKEPSCPSL